MRNLQSLMLSLNSQSKEHFELSKILGNGNKYCPHPQSISFWQEARPDQTVSNPYPGATNCQLQVFFSSSPAPNEFFLSPPLPSLQLKQLKSSTAEAHYCGHGETALSEVREPVPWKLST